MPQMWPMMWEYLFISVILFTLVQNNKFMYMLNEMKSTFNKSSMNSTLKKMKW